MANSPGTTIPYFGTSSGGSVANMYFTSSGSPVSLTVDGIHTNEIIADAYDVFGYYEVPTSGLPTLHPLFTTNPNTSPISIGSTTTFNPTGNYGYYIENIKGGGTALESDYIFYMNDAWDQQLSLGPDGLQHFAVFQNGSNYIIGDVDGVGCTTNVACVHPGDFDFQDILVTAVNTPEPATFGLMGGSLLLFGGFVRRKLRRSS
ncbi:MAG: PEP-CTERM sorting domain-containing protein [Acidobacteriaceae bacterium]|nr:PEP-CTERM sorting domain-containing protein [Acidobacteriaceae bacterium]